MELVIAENDIYIKRPDGYYDVVFGVDGWVVYTPHGRYTKSGLNESSCPRRDGWTKRAEARAFMITLLGRPA